MTPVWQICFLFNFILFTDANVFLTQSSANQILQRLKRANSPFEELRKGNLERECYEEKCSKEEAREVFEDIDKTNEFWNKYVDGDQCEKKPCQNNAPCKDGIGEYTCLCSEGFQGKNCEVEIPKLCQNDNGNCDHFCKVVQETVRCMCADGYYLDDDGKSCIAKEAFSCGRIRAPITRSTIDEQIVPVTEMMMSDSSYNVTMSNVSTSNTRNGTVNEAFIEAVEDDGNRIVGGTDCKPGQCPWQALLVNEENLGFCGGTILSETIVLTAAHCMNQSRSFIVVVGEHDTSKDEGRESKHRVERVIAHNKYVPQTYDNDIALLKLKDKITFNKYVIPACLPDKEFSEKVLMKEGYGQISGFGRIHERGRQSTVLQQLSVPYVDRQVCMESSQFKITVNMFCSGYEEEGKDACQGDSGGPHVTRYKNTWFVTGVISWGEGCARQGKYGVYTQISRYIGWIKKAMKVLNS
ncbi:coagulation factor X [Polypterus senegalus]|uniref:coagulation factor X n=1 Tax=Polypterus senegalus TaxID=55291 RepID=UPI001962F01D|nr:coagulation factor X [Polypterus senegalus]